jgi:hypothetical protein
MVCCIPEHLRKAAYPVMGYDDGFSNSDDYWKAQEELKEDGCEYCTNKCYEEVKNGRV